MSLNIHKTAIVSSKAELADGVTVGPYAIIDDDVVIGENCRIDAFASIKQYTRMGKNNHIYSYAMVGETPQDLKFHGEITRLEIGDNNRIREFSTLHRGTENGGALTKIGNNCLLMAYIHVAHDCILKDNIIMSNAATLAGHVHVESNAILGGLSAVHQFVRIGRNSFLGGATSITQDLPPFTLAVGNRGALHGLNLIGLKRGGTPKPNIMALRSAFKLIWLSGLPRQEALEKAEQQFPEFPEVQELIAFVRGSERGVLPVDNSAASTQDAAE